MTDQEIRALWVRGGRLWERWVYPAADSTLAEVDLSLWHEMFDDLPFEAMAAALVSLSTRDFAPPPGKIREEALRLIQRQSGEPEVPDVDEAWAEVVATVRHLGRLTSNPTFFHPAITETVRSIGWLEICNSTEQGVMRGQFFRLYEICKQRTQREAIPPAPALVPFLSGGVFKRVDDVLAIGSGSENGEAR